MEIVNEIYRYSETFPKLPDGNNIISREEEIEHIKEQVDSHQVTYLTGKEGVGLTTVLALFAKKYKAISYFIDGFSTIKMDSQNIEDSINIQLEFFNKLQNFCEEHIENIHKNITRAKNSRRPIYFVFDGFYRVPAAIGENIKRVLTPILEISNAKILFSAKTEEHNAIDDILVDYNKDKGSYFLNPLKSAEVGLHFENISAIQWKNCDKDLKDSIIKICAGYPERISAIDNKIRLGVSLEDIGNIYTYSNGNGDIFYNDWFKYEDDAKANILLALIAFSEMELDKDSTIKILKIDGSDFDNLIEFCKDSLQINENGIIEYILPSFRKYVREKLNSTKQHVEMLLIEYLEHDNTDLNVSVKYIPTLYSALGRNKQLIKYLNQENIIQFLINKKSQASINEQCDYGFSAGKNAKITSPEVLRFAINRSASREIENNELYDSEIEALVSIGEIDNAYAIVQNIHLKEERLKCLLLIAKKKNKFASPLFSEIEKDIESLTNDIDFEHIPEKAIRIAKLMLHIDFPKALSIIDRVAKSSNDREQFDRLYTEISLSYEESYEDKDDPTKTDIVSTRVNDEGLKKMAIAMKSIMKDCTMQQLIDELGKLPNPEMRLYVLQFWIPDHKGHQDIEKIVLYAIRLVIQIANTFIPKAEFLCKFCTPLDRISKQGLDEIIEIINAVEDTIKYPSVNYVDLKLMIIKAASKFDIDMATINLMYLYDDICQYEDKSISVHCKSKILNTFNKLNNYNFVEDNWKSINDLKTEIYTEILDLLKDSAYHLRMVVGPIKELICDYGNDVIIPIINKINTKERRSRAYYLACIEYINNSEILQINYNYFDLLYQRIDYDKSDCTFVMIRLFETIVYSEKAKGINVNDIKKQYQKIKDIENIYAQCYLYSILYVWFRKEYESDSFGNTIKNDLLQKWDKIDVQWDKISVGYAIAEQLSKLSSKDEAKEMITKASEIKQKLSFGCTSSVNAFLISLNLYVESLGTLIRSNLCTDEDIEYFDNILNNVASKSLTMRLWGKIALEFYLINQEKFKDIVTKHLSTNLDYLSTSEQKRVFYDIAPALFLTGKRTFYQKIEKFDEFFQNQCFDVICRFIINKFAYSEYTNTNSDYTTSLTYDEYENIFDIIEHSKDENSIFVCTEIICKSLNKNNKKISVEQKKMLFGSLKKLIEDKLPIEGGFPHNGYKIACLTAIECSSGNFDEKNWDHITTEIESIDNIADQSFLYSYISTYSKKKTNQIAFINKGFEKATLIPNSFDKVSRFDMCLSEAIDQNMPNIVRDLSQKEFNWLMNNKNGNYTDAQKMIDLLQEFNERQDNKDFNIVDNFMEKLDNDPARLSYRYGLKKYIQKKQKVKSANKNISSISELPTSELNAFFETKLKSIINDSAITNAIDFDTVFPIFETIYSNSISVTKTAISYFMEYFYTKNKKSKGYYKESLKEINKALLYNLKIVLSLASETKDKFDRINGIIQDSFAKTKETHIRVGQKEKAIKYIKEWYLRHITYDRLRIIDPYFEPEFLYIIKELMSINNHLDVNILTGHYDSNKAIDLDEYQKFWNEISSELPGKIVIYSFCYENKKCPVHDRYWTIINSETREKDCITLPYGTLGKRETSIGNDKNDINAADKMWEDYVSYQTRRDKNGEIQYYGPYNLH